MKKKLLISVVIIIFSLVAFYYIFMVMPTNSVEDAVKYAFLCNGIYDDNVSKYMTEDVFYRINIDRYYTTTDFNKTVKKNLTLKRNFVLHNFTEGYIWMNYSFEALDKDNKVIHGSWDIPVKLKIKFINGYWKIISKYEAA